jgi:hypothetical protein
MHSCVTKGVHAWGAEGLAVLLDCGDIRLAGQLGQLLMESVCPVEQRSWTGMLREQTQQSGQQNMPG